MRIVAYVGLTVLVLLAGPVAAQQPSQTQINAIKQNCRGDYPTYCSGVPTGGSAALQCLQQNASAVSPQCRQALGALNTAGDRPPSPSSPNPSSAPAATASRPAPPPLSPREEAAVVRADCRRDYRALCPGVRPGGGRAIACLDGHAPQLSPMCRSALLSLRHSS